MRKDEYISMKTKIKIPELRRSDINQLKGLRINDQPNNATAIMFGKKSDNNIAVIV